jgi:hypothetical protein
LVALTETEIDAWQTWLEAGSTSLPASRILP